MLSAGLPNAPHAVNAWFGSLSAARQAPLLSRSAPLRLWLGEMVLVSRGALAMMLGVT